MTDLFLNGLVGRVVALVGVTSDNCPRLRRLLVMAGRRVDVLRVADRQVPLERQHRVQEDGAVRQPKRLLY